MQSPILCPLDGRYASTVKPLALCMGEAALTRARVRAECIWLEVLSGLNLPGLAPLSAPEKQQLAHLAELSEQDLQAIRAYEQTGRNGIKATRHDVKAIEYFLKEKLAATPLKNRAEWLHFALTSEDINSAAYAVLLADGLERVLLPALENLRRRLAALARREAAAPLLARTHGQAAVPTTFGKEVRVFESRLSEQLNQLKKRQISFKFSGAVGNYNAHYAAFSQINWPRVSARVAAALNRGRKIKLYLSPLSTQIDNRDSYAELFDNLRRIHLILLGLCQDFWRYISDGLLRQKAIAGEVGSSTMPQKINPIHFENAEGNLQLSDALFTFFSAKLPLSRLQRDLSDSTVLRNMGVAFGYALVAYTSLAEGLERVSFNRALAKAQLAQHPEVLAEGIQTILRAAGQAKPYEQLKALTRGRTITQEDLQVFIENLQVEPVIKNKLRALNVFNYTGLAAQRARGK